MSGEYGGCGARGHVDDPLSMQLLRRYEVWHCPCGQKGLELCFLGNIVVFLSLTLEALIEEIIPVEFPHFW
jgi:hypothetical protein